MPITFSSDLKARTVLDDGGNVVGTIDEILVDPSSWRVEALRVKLDRGTSKEVGARSGVFQSAIVEIPCAMVQAAGDAVILSVSRAALQDLVKDTGDSGQPPETGAERPTH
jgi:sporulation protein YlmC with PRC-barrel domain